MKINYISADATQPAGPGPRIIAHVCNDLGRWGKGFVLALSKRWPEPERCFRAWHAEGGPVPFALGQVQFVEVEPALWVANAIGQHGIMPQDGVPPIRYDALTQALARVALYAIEHGASVHMPRIGCGLAGGRWDMVEPIIQASLADRGIHVAVYDLPSNSPPKDLPAAPRRAVVWQGRHLRVAVEDGWEYVQRNNISGIVGVVAVTDERRLVLVEQYRPPVDRRVIELPAGLAGDTPESRSESLEQAARRELLEETGYEAHTMEFLCEGAASAGLSDEMVSLFLARGLKKIGDAAGDGSEDITVHEVPLDQVHQWIAARRCSGATVDFKVFAGLEIARTSGGLP